MIPFTLPDVQVSLTVTSLTGNVEMLGTGSQILVQNVDSTECFIMVADSEAGAVALAFDSVSMPGNTQRIFSINPNATHIAAITASGTTTLRVARGDGS